MMTYRLLRPVLAVLLLCFAQSLVSPPAAEAQKRRATKGRVVKKAKRARRRRARTRPVPKTETVGLVAEEVDESERVKEFRFSGLDVSGRLRSPQMLYFLNRVRAEFDRPRLPHRSFIPELKRTTKEDPF